MSKTAIRLALFLVLYFAVFYRIFLERSLFERAALALPVSIFAYALFVFIYRGHIRLFGAGTRRTINMIRGIVRIPPK